MGIRDKAKKIKQLLPIVGAGGNVSPTASGGVPVRPPEPPVAATPPATRDVQAYIGEIVGEHPVVLFMKGSPSSPMCGFSANAAGILASYGGDLFHVDVIADPEVRQGIKEFSNWPTLPQVYVGGEFLGGSDILMQMHQAGELEEMIAQARSSS